MRLGIVKMENFVFLLPAALAFHYLCTVGRGSADVEKEGLSGQQRKICVMEKNKAPRGGGNASRGKRPLGKASSPQAKPRKGAVGSSRSRKASPEDEVKFGNRKSVFVAPEKRRRMQAEVPQEEETAQSRHASYQNRYQDRVRSGASLSKKRLELSAERGEGLHRTPVRRGAARAFYDSL